MKTDSYRIALFLLLFSFAFMSLFFIVTFIKAFNLGTSLAVYLPSIESLWIGDMYIISNLPSLFFVIFINLIIILPPLFFVVFETIRARGE